jgi:outer membrane protein TolC
MMPRILPILLAVILSGCVAYTPAPLDPAVVLQQQAAAAIDENAVSDEIGRIAPAIQWDGKHWDRLSLLAAALIGNAEIAQARSSVTALEAEAKAAGVAPGYSLTLTTEYAFNAPEASPWLLGVAGDFPLDTGTRRAARIGIAELNARIALFDYLDTTWSVRSGIRRALAEYLLARREALLAAELAELDRRQVSAMERRLAAGAASHADIERVRLAAAANLQRLSDAEARVATAQLQLSAAVGVAAAALDPSALDWPAVDAPRSLSGQLPSNCLDQALLARPDVARASRNYDKAEQALRAAVASQYPALHLGPGYTWERGLKKLPFALGLSMPSLDFNHAAIASAEAQREQAGRALEAVVAAARNGIELAQSDYRAAWVQLDRARQQSQIASRLATQADSAFRAGAADRLEWSATLDELAAVRNVRAAEASLEDALRRPLEGPELAITNGPTSAEDPACKLPAP